MDDVDLIGTEYIWRVRTYVYCLVQLIFWRNSIFWKFSSK